MKNAWILFLLVIFSIAAIFNLQGCIARRHGIDKKLVEIQKQMKQKDLKLFGSACFELRERMEKIQESNLQYAGFTSEEQDELAADLVHNVPLFSTRERRVSEYLEAIGASPNLEYKSRIGYLVVMQEALSNPEVKKGGDLVIGGVYDAWLKDMVNSAACKNREIFDWPCSPFIPPARCKRMQEEMKPDQFQKFIDSLWSISNSLERKFQENNHKN